MSRSNIIDLKTKIQEEAETILEEKQVTLNNYKVEIAAISKDFCKKYGLNIRTIRGIVLTAWCNYGRKIYPSFDTFFPHYKERV